MKSESITQFLTWLSYLVFNKSAQFIPHLFVKCTAPTVINEYVPNAFLKNIKITRLKITKIMLSRAATERKKL